MAAFFTCKPDCGETKSTPSSRGPRFLPTKVRGLAPVPPPGPADCQSRRCGAAAPGAHPPTRPPRARARAQRLPACLPARPPACLPARPPDKAREPSLRAMSSSSGSGHQPSQSRAIPTRTVPISDAAQLPHDYCTTPGGTLFSTTPGGTRIIYDRKFLLDRRNSPMAQTPPCHLPNIPGVTSPGTLIEDSKVEVNNLNNLNNHDRKQAVGDDAQFEMDI